MLESLPPVPLKKRVSSFEILFGTPIPKIDKLYNMSEDDFEVMVLEWAHEYLSKQYVEVRQFGGSNDKGRDVVGLYADGNSDIFQCKHYDSPIAPTNIYVELGKLCYYTLKGDYKMPLSYFIVSPKGVGPTLQDLIDEPSQINQKLIDNWENYCKKNITKRLDVELSGELKTYVEDFDFSIVKVKQPHELIGEHGKTTYHASRFGGGLLKYRDIIPKAVEEVDKRELDYTEQLMKIYSQELGKTISTKTELEIHDSGFFQHFNHHRDCFYSAESLEKFSRENFPDASPLPFDEIKEDAYSVVENTLLINKRESGLKRLTHSIQEVLRSTFGSNPLRDEIREMDKKGVCHYLANEKRVKWIE